MAGQVQQEEAIHLWRGQGQERSC